MTNGRAAHDGQVGAEKAEAIAVEALAFIAADPVLLPRFLAITGISAPQIREAAAEAGFLAGVLDFILAHEPTLLAFAQSAELDPAMARAARQSLPLGDERYQTST